jgi:hypothetical protein
MAELLASKASLIEEHKKMCEQHYLFERASHLDVI